MTITLFDILILLALVGGAAWGFYRGVVRQAAMTLIIYISTVISTLTYRGVANLISGGRSTSTAGVDMMSFVMVMVVINLMLFFIINDLIKDLDLRRLGMWSNIGGMAFGFLNVSIWCAVLLLIIRSSVNGPEWIGYQGVQVFFQNQTQRSLMVFVFSPLMRMMMALIQPWLFGRSLPPLLMNAF